MNVSELARKTKVPTPTIHRIVTGKSTRPYRSSLVPIADYFNISVDQLLGEEALPEVNSNSNSLAGHIPIKNIPVIPWDELKVKDDIEIDCKKVVPFLGEISEHGFATVLPDTSMEPMFVQNSILIIDPKSEISDRNFILALLGPNHIPVLRQILNDADHKYIKAINSDLCELQMRLLTDKDKILGKLLESRVNFSQ